MIALTIVGVIASLSTSLLVANVQDTRFKAAYRKAYSTIANITYTLKANDALPKSSEPIEGFKFFKNLVSNIEVEGYADSGTSEANVIKRGQNLNQIK